MAVPTLDRPDQTSPDEARPSTHRRDGLLVGFFGAVLAFHLVVLAMLAFVAVATRGGVVADEAAIAARTNVVATEFAFEVDRQPSGSPIEMTLDNQGDIFHNLLIEGVNGFVLEADAAQSAIGVIQLPDGTWVLYCSVPGHREAGMEADLVVGG